jgi:hypothetical protein
LPTLYGRDEESWEELTRTGAAFLVERARLQKVTSYTELNTVLANRTGQPSFDFSQQDGRAAMGRLLGGVVDTTWDPDNGVMLSALVLYLGENDAGPGFYALAADKGLIARNARAAARFEFWAMQVKKIYEVYGSSRSHRPT